MAKAHVNINEGKTFNVTKTTSGINVEMVWLIFWQLSQTYTGFLILTLVSTGFAPGPRFYNGVVKQ